MKITWRMYSWHSAWYCQSHKPLLKNPLPQAPSSESYIPVLKEKKQPGEIRSYEQTTRPNICIKGECLLWNISHMRPQKRYWRLRMNKYARVVFYVILTNFICLQRWFLFVLSLQNDCWEICVLTWLNVFSNNADVFISVRPCVFVPESNHMTQFMHHNSELVAVFPDWYGLRPTSTTTHIGAAPMNE